MKTNQQMVVPIGNLGEISIGHLTQFGRASDIMTMGNLLREQRGLRPIELREILVKEDFWEFAIALNAKLISESQSVDSTLRDLSNQNNNLSQTPESGVRDLSNQNNDLSQNPVTGVRDLSNQNNDLSQSAVTALWIEPDFDKLEKYKSKDRKIEYSKLIKEMPMVIKSQRGGKPENRGVWMQLLLLLKLAAYLDKTLEVEIFDCFVKGKILEWRDDSGDSFKELCSILNQKGLISCDEDYKDISRNIKIAILGQRFKGVKDVWNKIATKEQIEKRNNLEKYLIKIVQDGLITSIDQCYKIIHTF